ncbi:hypothetical protein EDC04DRAFT_1804114 [Pisolithus marmoratus]|nr:hypothetical protein EDC04DRAFT_1804114 [Pisolithus marmoratus]
MDIDRRKPYWPWGAPTDTKQIKDCTAPSHDIRSTPTICLSFHSMTKKNDNSAEGSQTPNREAMMQEAIMSAVGTAVKPVTAGLDNVQKRLGTIVTHVENNTVTAHDEMLQKRVEPLHTALGTLQSDILSGVDQRSTALNSNLESLRDQTVVANQRLDTLGQSVQAARDVVDDTREQVNGVANAQHVTNGHVTDVLVSSYQIYNADRGSGFHYSFKIIPFINKDGTVQWPTACNLPPLLNIRVIDNLKTDELDQYLDGYGINHAGLDRELKLSKLREHIGCAPPDRSSSHGMTFFFMLVMGCLFYVYFPQLFD